MNDTYLSVIRALEHAACSVGRKLKTCFINSTDLDDPDADDDARERAAAVYEVLEHCDGILVPGGFGVRGVEGKLRAVKFAREKKKPFLGSSGRNFVSHARRRRHHRRCIQHIGANASMHLVTTAPVPRRAGSHVRILPVGVP